MNNTIMIVDDDELITITLSKLINNSFKHKVIAENNPQKALDCKELKEGKVDLLITDFLMPQMSGLEFLKKAKEISPKTVLILLTGYADKENAIKCINEVGLYYYIEKPWNNNEIIKVINNSIEKKRLTDELEEKIINLQKTNLEVNELYNEVKQILEAYKTQNELLKQLSTKVLKAHEDERKRIAREIHDGPAQVLADIYMKTEICKRHVATQKFSELDNTFSELRNEIDITLKDIRSIIYDLKPIHSDKRLFKGIKEFADAFKKSSGVEVDFKKKGSDSGLEYYFVCTIFRIIKEALSNVRKHAQAKNVRINMTISNNNLEISIIDDGKGFEVDKIASKSVLGGFGIESINERVELLRGDVKIDSSIGEGTKIYICIPLNNKS